MGTLLISKPNNGKLNYQQTLAIRFNRETDKLNLDYSDWDTVEREEDFKEAIIWAAECSGQELQEKFEEFIAWNKAWA